MSDQTLENEIPKGKRVVIVDGEGNKAEINLDGYAVTEPFTGVIFQGGNAGDGTNPYATTEQLTALEAQLDTKISSEQQRLNARATAKATYLQANADQKAILNIAEEWI